MTRPRQSSRYYGHGLVVDSEFELALQSHPAAGADADVTFSRADDREVSTQPAGEELLARLDDVTGTPRLLISRSRDSTSVQYPGLCEFVGDRELRTISVHRHPGAPPGFVGILAAGAVLTAHLVLAAEHVLHASAVEVGAGAVAFVGSSGMGKSTVAAMLAARGHALVSDDVLRVVADGGSGHRVFAGGVEHRLRTKAWSLSSTMGDVATAPTADGRLSVRPRATEAVTLPLLACVIPMPSRVHDAVVVTPLSPADSMRRLLRYPRIVGWVDPTVLAQELWAAGALAADTPIFEAHIPWGPPFRTDIAESLLTQLPLAAGCPSSAF